MLRKLSVWVVFIVALLSVFLSSKTAFASSIYDSTVTTTSTLLLSSSTCPAKNHQADWNSIFSDSTFWSNSVGASYTTVHDAYVAALSNDSGWSVTQRTWQANGISIGDWYRANSGDKIIQVNLTADSSNSVDFVTSGGLKFAYLHSPNPTPVYTVYVGLDSSCQMKVIVARSTTGNFTPDQFAGDPVAGDVGSIAKLDSYFANAPINYPADGYAGVRMASSAPQQRKYVALGDSFSSGEGNPPYNTGTDTPNVNECHRSSTAYPNILASMAYLNLTNFTACSGATTANIATVGQWNENPQYNAIPEDANVVTLSVGGNDIGFKDYAYDCATTSCDFSTSIYTTTDNHIRYDLPTKLLNTFNAIRIATEYNTSIKVYVVGYPFIVPAEMPSGTDCLPFNGGTNNPDPTLDNGAAVRKIQTDLNAAIKLAVDNFNAAYNTTEFQYVDPNGDNSPFLGHDWCSGSSYFHDLDAINQATSYHPTVDGQKAYAEILQLVIN